MSPRERLAPAREFVLVQEEFYLGDAASEQFDTVYLGAPPGSAIHGVQTFTVPAGGGMCFELVCDVAGEFPFVNHGFGHGQKGSIGFLVVES